MLRLIQENMIKSELSSRATTEIMSKPENRVKQQLIDSYIIGDAFEGLAKIQSGVIQYVEADPPYGIHLLSRMRGFQSDRATFAAEDYHEVKEKDYEEFLGTMLSECYRVMTKNSWLTLWIGIDPWAEVAYQLLLKTGFKTNRVFAIWHKAKPPYHSSQPHTHLASAYDAFYYARKGDATLFRQGQPNLFSYPQVPRKEHPTEKPIELLTHMTSLFTLPGCTVLVPFLGSGNTLLAAANCGCQAASGFDLAVNYKNAFNLKVLGQIYGQYSSYGGNYADAERMAAATSTAVGA